jgi:hypothetical protein
MITNRIFKILTILNLFVVGSCASSKLVAPDLELIYTKKNKNVGGVVVYNPHGLSNVVNSRKSHALTRMRTACLPSAYEVIKEQIKKIAEVNTKYKGDLELFAGRTAKFLEYRCIRN